MPVDGVITRGRLASVTLMEAVWTGDARVLAVRLAEGGRVDWGARSNHHGWPPLHQTVYHRRTAVAKLLLGAGAEVDETDESGWMPLHSAADYGHLDIAELLLQAGADVNAVTKYGNTPLHFATCGHLALVKLLLQAGADVNAASNAGDTPLHFNVVNAAEGHLALVKLLCSYGATRNGKEVEKATGYGWHGTAAWLTSTADYTTALHYILPPNDLVPPPRARALLRAGADIRAARTEDGPTPLRLARQLEAEGNAPDGSTARLILRAAGPWTRETHELFPAERRAEACSLVVSIGHIHARRCKGSGYPERVDFSALVLGYAISR
jgi:ankyrin repeat protein